MPKKRGRLCSDVTLNVYAHLVKSKNQEAACKLEKAVFEANGSKMVADSEKKLRKGLRILP